MKTYEKTACLGIVRKTRTILTAAKTFKSCNNNKGKLGSIQNVPETAES